MSSTYCALFQFGNTCYSNSVLQALYFCRPFREKVLEYKARNKRTKETLLTCLADLFYNIATQKKKVRLLSRTWDECLWGSTVCLDRSIIFACNAGILCLNWMMGSCCRYR